MRASRRPRIRGPWFTALAACCFALELGACAPAAETPKPAAAPSLAEPDLEDLPPAAFHDAARGLCGAPVAPEAALGRVELWAPASAGWLRSLFRPRLVNLVPLSLDGCTLSPDAELLGCIAAAERPARLTLWEARSGRFLRSYVLPRPAGGRFGEYDELALSAREHQLALTVGLGGWILLDLRTGLPRARGKEGFLLPTVQFARDGSGAVAGFVPHSSWRGPGRGSAPAPRLFWLSVAEGRMRPLPGEAFPDRDAALSPDGKWLAQAGGSLLQVWDLSTGKIALERRLGPAERSAAAFSAQGDALLVGVTARPGELRLLVFDPRDWRAAPGERPARAGEGLVTQLSADGRHGLFCARPFEPGACEVVELESGELRHGFERRYDLEEAVLLEGEVWLPGGFARLAAQRTLRLHDLGADSLAWTLGSTRSVGERFGYSADGRSFQLLDEEPVVALDLDDGRWREQPSGALAGPDGHHWSADVNRANFSRERGLLIYDRATGAPRLEDPAPFDLEQADLLSFVPVLLSLDASRLVANRLNELRFYRLPGLDLRRCWPRRPGPLARVVVLPPSDPQGAFDWFAQTPEGFFDSSPGARRFAAWQVGDELLPLELLEARWRAPGRVRRALAHPAR